MLVNGNPVNRFLTAALYILAFIGIVGSEPVLAQRMQSAKLDFEAAPLGSTPPGFKAELTGKGTPPVWEVMKDPSAPAGSMIVAETSDDRTDYRFPLLIWDELDAKNVQVTVAFKPVSGRVDQAAGLVVRFKDENNYYIARANALEGNVRLYKVVEGKRVQLAGQEVKVLTNQWQTLSLKAQDDNLEVQLDGRRLFGVRDETFKQAGKVGLWTKADSLTYFDDLRAELIP